MGDSDSLADAVQKVQDDARRELARRALVKLPQRQMVACQKLETGIENFLLRMNEAQPVPNPGTHELNMKDQYGLRRTERVWSIHWTAWEFPQHFGLTPEGGFQYLNKDWTVWECPGRLHLAPDGRLHNLDNEWVHYNDAVFFEGIDYDPMPEADAALDALAALIRQHLG
jgi:hypothetical protein